jgi:acyl-coenzyme A synthetase/AMP-(fatty) acid ligase
MLLSDSGSLWNLLSAAGRLSDRYLWGANASVRLDGLARHTSLGGKLEELRGRSVLLITKDQLSTALALIELDGVARRMVLCPPDLRAEHLPLIAEDTAADAIVSDRPASEAVFKDVKCYVECSPNLLPCESVRTANVQTEWVLLTSGTTGIPKTVLHTLHSLAGAIKGVQGPGQNAVWGTFYDIRRYGGLQILLRALLDGGSLVLSSAEESTEDFLVRMGSHNVTHVSGTPSHWRRALMSPLARKISPKYVRLSGEVADQAILDSLREFFQGANVAHAFASTEAGVAFAIDDGLSGFPSNLIDRPGAAVEMKVSEGSLRIRSARNATRYLGNRDGNIVDQDGFVDTRDMVELRDGRYYFIGRRDGVINVGGLKVHPEEIEAVINRHPKVRMSLVKPRKNAITGAIVVAEVVLESKPEDNATGGQNDALKKEILETCRGALAPYKVPAAIRFVSSLDVAASGKLARV